MDKASRERADFEQECRDREDRLADEASELFEACKELLANWEGDIRPYIADIRYIVNRIENGGETTVDIMEIVNAGELFDIDGTEISDRNELAEWITTNNCIIEESSWQDRDAEKWPPIAQAGRRVAVLTPTVDGQRRPLAESVVVIGQ